MEKKAEATKQTEEAKASTALTVPTGVLNEESLRIIGQIITEQDTQKTKDLTYLFNQNQNKKTMVRANKLNELLDVITDEAVTRFTKNPDEISNKDLLDGLKTVQDLIERSQSQVNGVTDQPLIQINQQTNSVNVGDQGPQLSRDSRERVKNAVMNLLSGLTPKTDDKDAGGDEDVAYDGKKAPDESKVIDADAIAEQEEKLEEAGTKPSDDKPDD